VVLATNTITGKTQGDDRQQEQAEASNPAKRAPTAFHRYSGRTTWNTGTGASVPIGSVSIPGGYVIRDNWTRASRLYTTTLPIRFGPNLRRTDARWFASRSGGKGNCSPRQAPGACSAPPSSLSTLSTPSSHSPACNKKSEATIMSPADPDKKGRAASPFSSRSRPLTSPSAHPKTGTSSGNRHDIHPSCGELAHR
jgi:hypothetical protein